MKDGISTGLVGKIKSEVIGVLGLSIEADTPIFLGQSNIEHMMNNNHCHT